MRRRPPATLVAYIGVLAVVLLTSFIADGADPRLIVGGLALAAGAAGLYLGSRVAWIIVTAVHAVNLLLAVATEAEWWIVAIAIVPLALLLAPPTRRYVQRDPDAAAQPVSRGRRALRLGAAVLAGLLLIPLGVGALFTPDPISGDLDLVRSDRPGVRVLIIGNALVSQNKMIEMLRDLAAADPGAPPVFAVRYAPRGSKLIEAAQDDALRELLTDERWDHVVLQEHSQVVSRPSDRQKHKTGESATYFSAMARRAGARTALFVQGGYRDGDGKVDGDTYAAMQSRIADGYRAVNAGLRATSVPIASAWELAMQEQPEIDLWHRDGIRPSRAGSYLIACVLYAALTRRDPADLRFADDLERPRARALQDIARRAAEPP